MEQTFLTLTLDCGIVKILLKEDKAPMHCKQITDLCTKNFYNGLIFHRVIEGFMAQGGCPDGNGRSGSGKKIKAEFNDLSHLRGTVSMARSNDPNSADSQFFICLDGCEYLDNNYTIWGEVVEGMEVVDKIAVGEPPKTPTKIIKATVDTSLNETTTASA